jgi:hypothetical protein
MTAKTILGFPALLFFYLILFYNGVAFSLPRINEIMANNESTIVDVDGEFSDWIEIYNPDLEDMNLGGYFLTDNSDNLMKWKFPDFILKAGEYIIVFASGKEKNILGIKKELHTNFELSSKGEYIGLISPDGTTIVSEVAPKFEKQESDESYGLGIWGEADSSMLVQDNSILKYFVPDSEALSDSWLLPGNEFDDSQWNNAKQPVGFESIAGTLERLVETNISDAMKGKNSSAYCRFPFIFDKSKKKSCRRRIESNDR